MTLRKSTSISPYLDAEVAAPIPVVGLLVTYGGFPFLLCLQKHTHTAFSRLKIQCYNEREQSTKVYILPYEQLVIGVAYTYRGTVQKV